MILCRFAGRLFLLVRCRCRLQECMSKSEVSCWIWHRWTTGVLLVLAIFAVSSNAFACTLERVWKFYAGCCQCILVSAGELQITTHTALFVLSIKDVSKLLWTVLQRRWGPWGYSELAAAASRLLQTGQSQHVLLIGGRQAAAVLQDKFEAALAQVWVLILMKLKFLHKRNFRYILVVELLVCVDVLITPSACSVHSVVLTRAVRQVNHVVEQCTIRVRLTHSMCCMLVQ